MPRTAIILAGGLGTRLHPLTQIIPKPLLPIGEKSILEIQIENLKKYGFTRIYIATNYKSNYIKSFLGDGSRYGVTLHILQENIPLGTAGPIKLLENILTDQPFIVMNGDILSLVNLTKLYEIGCENPSILTVGIKKIITPYAFGNIYFNNHRVTKIEEKPNMITYALAGIYVMRPEIMKHIPVAQYFCMDTLIKNMLANEMPIYKHEIEEYWLDIGQIDDYQKAQNNYHEFYKEESAACL